MRSTLSLILVIFSFGAFAQISTFPAKLDQYRKNKIHRPELKSNDALSYILEHKSLFGLGPDDALKEFRSWSTGQNRTIIRYRQYYKGIPLLGSNYIAHLTNGNLTGLSGVLYPGVDIKNVNVDKDYIDIDAVKLQLSNSMTYWEYPEFDMEKWVIDDKGLVILDAAYPNFSGQYKLCRHFQIESDNTSYPLNEDVYVDVKSSKLVNHFSNIHTDRVKGVVNTKYYGEKEVYIDSLAPDMYLLKDSEKSIHTLNADRDTFVNDSKYWNQVNIDQNEVAGDVHFSASSFYDMMQNRYNWKGLDGQGHELSSVVHVRGRYYVNAFWDGKKANFGNGDCDRYHPLTTLGIVGHEFVHGFTDYTSDLVYRNESGALNESISDIFGKALEYYYDFQNFNWLLGDRIRKNENVNVVRNMQDPNHRNHPKYYGGHHWRTGSSDNGGVHSNSGVLNYWFYLLVEGGDGYNEDDYYFNVDAMGMGKALDLVFELQTAYLTENSDYLDAMRYSFSAAEDIFGSASKEYAAVVEAWKAVGLYEDIDLYDLSISGYQLPDALCSEDSFMPGFRIDHLGTDLIPRGEAITIKLKGEAGLDQKREVVLNDDLLPGDSLIFLWDDDLSSYIDNQTLITAHVQYDHDKIVLNNHVNHSIRKSESIGKDVEILIGEFGIYEECEQTGLDYFRFRINNSGCQTFAADDTLVFSIATDKGNFELDRRLFIDITPGTIYGSSIGITNRNLPKDFTVFDIELKFPGDIEPSNNLISGEVTRRPVVPANYFEPFESDEMLSYLEINGNENYVTDSLLYWRSNRVLVLGARSQHSNYKNCEIDFDFHDQYFFQSRLSFCVDTRGLEDPVFSFDLMQKRNASATSTPVNPLYASMLSLNVDMPEHEELFVYGQEQSQFIHQEYVLPEDYLGPVEFDITNITGIELWSDLDFFDRRDLVAFDNFRIHSRGAILSDVDEADYLVFPNPVQGLLKVMNKNQDTRFSIEVYDVFGRLMHSKKDILNQYWFDTSAFPESMYQVYIYENDKAVTRRQIMVGGK